MITRRTAAKGLLATGAIMASGVAFRGYALGSAQAQTATNRLNIPPMEPGRLVNGERVFDLRLQQGHTRFFRDFLTPTLGINGDFLGPTLKMTNGERVRFNVTNAIGEPSTLHWHGLHLPASADGGPHQAIANNSTWSPNFTIRQNPATFWYHSHMLHKTGEQVWKGLAGLLIVEDDASRALDLPNRYGVDDIPLVLQDRAFNNDGTFRYVTSMHDVMMGMSGDVPLANGTVDAVFEAGAEKIRLRILNGSNARFLNLGLSDNRIFHQVATDGGLLEQPVEMVRVVLGPGERAEIVVDVSNGQPVALTDFGLSRGGGRGRGMMGMMRRGMDMVLGNEGPGVDFVIIRPAQNLAASPVLPEKLTVLPTLNPGDAAKTRSFVLEMGMGPRMMMGGGGNAFTINGKAMDMGRIDERVRLGDTEIWQISNRSPLPHPFHIHNIQFLILDRNGSPPAPGERGLKDTVTVYAQETVRVIARFDDYADPDLPYMYHCHILEHEDAGMMGQFTVEA